MPSPSNREVNFGQFLKEKHNEKLVGMGSVIFGPNGQMLTGGYQAESKTGVDLSPALLFDANLARPPSESSLPGEGPVAFVDAETPVQLVLPSRDRNNLVLWNVTKNLKLAEIPLPDTFHTVEHIAAALSNDGRLAAVSATQLPDQDGQRTGETILWSLDPKTPGASGRKLSSWPRPASALAFSPDTHYLAAGTVTGSVSLHDAATGKELFALDDSRLPILSLAFGRNFKKDATDKPRLAPGGLPGWMLAIGTDSGTATVWDLETKNRVNIFRGAAFYVNALAFSPDGSKLGHLTASVR